MAIHQSPPFNVDDLLNLRVVEGNRVEFKSTFDSSNEYQIVSTVSAFANDLLNLNGGYIILGVEESNGRPVLPPRGLDQESLDEIQKRLFELCNKITPSYQPVLFPVSFQGREIIIVWCPGGDNRPYRSPTPRQKNETDYHVRINSVTSGTSGKPDLLRQLLEQTARIPFDDRKALDARIEDISPLLVRRFLADVRSDLIAGAQPVDDLELFRRLRLMAPVNGHQVPRNVALLFFSEDPDRDRFRGARIEIVQFGDGAGGDLIEERVFRGPIPTQIKASLDYLEGLGGSLLKKSGTTAEVERTVAYPYAAMEEAIVNAAYHRSYEGPPEPIKVYLYPDRLEITSYPGPVAGLLPEHFAGQSPPPPVPARNRRIGEFLKELRLCESRGTGVPKIRRKMAENGSPAPSFDFDEQRTFFRVTLPVHPRYQILHALREAAHLWATGARSDALSLLLRTHENQPASGSVASQIIEYAFALGDLDRARRTLEIFATQSAKVNGPRPFLTMARLLLDHDLPDEARLLLGRMPPNSTHEEIIDAAILRKRGGDFAGAHTLFAQACTEERQNPRLLHEFAQTKKQLAKQENPNHQRGLDTRRRLAAEAADLLRSAIQLANSDTRAAWCWFDLAEVLQWLRRPLSEVESAYLRAIELLPEETRFTQAYRKWKDSSNWD